MVVGQFAKLRAFHAFAPYVPSRLMELLALIFTRLNYAPCVPYLCALCAFKSEKISYWQFQNVIKRHLKGEKFK